MSGGVLSSGEIARKAKSNLAFALGCLPEERRRDMISFYAFCRIVDDIADDPGTAPANKAHRLEDWKRAVLNGSTGTGDPVLDEVAVLPGKYGFDPAWLAEIIDGVRSDLSVVRYPTIGDLLNYCYKVASVVGLVSIEIFGCRHPSSRDYAINLGYALQLTNIMRDVGDDAQQTRRIYLPLEDLHRFEVTEAEILEGIHSERFVRLMDFQYQRARDFYDRAQQHLAAEDRPKMLASEMMAAIYSRILEKLRRQRYPVFAGRCRLHPVRKGLIFARFMIRRWLAAGRGWLGRGPAPAGC